MIIGDYKIDVVEGDSYLQDGGTMFGIIPKVFWSNHHPADEKNRITMACRCLLIQGNERIILVDNGIGDKLSEKKRSILGIKGTGNKLIESLEVLNIQTEDVTDVILTHLHFDHCGGSTKFIGNDVIPCFPKAQYWIQKEQWDWANIPSSRDRGSYYPEDFLPISENEQLTLCYEDYNLLPGIDVIVVHGHTPGMQVVKISDNKQTLLFPSDLVPTAAHLPEHYNTSFDQYPLFTQQEKQNILTQAIEESWIIVYSHDPWHIATTVEMGNKYFVKGPSMDHLFI